MQHSREAVEQSKTDAYIVERLKGALHQLKRCRSKDEWLDYHIILAAIAPERLSAAEASKHRSEGRSIEKVCARLELNPKARYPKGSKEPRQPAIQKAITRRAEFDAALDLQRAAPLKVGDTASTRGQSCTVVEIDYDADTCTLGFSLNGVEVVRSYTCIYKGKNAPGKAPFPKGSARLCQAPLSLRPTPPAIRKDATAEAARHKVEELFDQEGARSPSQRDSVRRRLGVGLYETAQALMVYATSAALYTMFRARYPGHKISFATFKKLRPWDARCAKEETCCCKQCDNFKQSQKTLRSLITLFERLLHDPPSANADDAPDDDAEESETSCWEGQVLLTELLTFCAITSKSEMVRSRLCNGAFDNAGKKACINCQCDACGFSQLWSKGLRKHIVDANGNVLQSAPVEFQSEVKWVRIRSSKKTEPGEAKQPSYEACRGTVVQFLDQFEQDVFRKFPHHRFTVQRQKATAAEFERNRWPGWLQFDVDFAMDGTIPPPQGRSMQADHWVPMSFTLFPNIASWLDTAAWISTSSTLAKGDAVTVEPAHAFKRGATEPALGSEWAEVVSTPSSTTEPSDPERRLYCVRRFGAGEDSAVEMIERRYLRHRKKRTTAFIHISDDKTHDSHAAQTFINKTLDWLQEHYVSTWKEKFVALHMHSDNAPSHFKSSKTMYYLTTLPVRLSLWAPAGRTFRIVWEFGAPAPGHGKGVWDGIGEWMKRTVREDIVGHTASMPTVLTSDGHILSTAQVYEHLKARFQTAEYVGIFFNAGRCQDTLAGRPP